MNTTWSHNITVAISLSISGCALIPALPLDRKVEAKRGEKVQLWYGANYGKPCDTAGPPKIAVTSRPKLGTVTIEAARYIVPDGQRCEKQIYDGRIVWYQAGSEAGTDVFTYSIEFPHQGYNNIPSERFSGTMTVVVK